MRTITIATAVVVLLAFLVVAMSKTVAVTKTTESRPQSEMSIYDLHVGYPNTKNLPIQEAPRP
jgi:hypothetical protein